MKKALCLLPFLATICSMFGCGQTDTELGGEVGSVALGQECRGYVDCAPLEGKVVHCVCTDEHDAPVCVAELAVGDTCSDGSSSGWGPPPCPAGSICLHTSLDVAASCVALGGLGDPCAAELTCAEPYTCLPRGGGVCSLASAGVGESCDITVSRSCAPPNVCTSSGCEPPAPIGAECRWDDQRNPCVEGAYCAFSGDTCRPLVPDGGECNEDRECSSGTCFFGQCGRGRVRGSLGCG